MRRRGRDHDAGVANLDAPDPMMQCQPDARPALRDLVRDALERLERQRFVRFVLQILDAPADVVIPDETEKRRDRAVRAASAVAAGTAAIERLERQRRRPDGQERESSPV